jgi:UDP-2-acetamido-3-amino-2,3-dideoxy-glucuronate N-acetyltransferase
MRHQYAVMDASVEIGTCTKVWQFATIIRSARIGEHCTIGACSVVDGAEVGNRCLIGHGAQLHPGTKIGNDVFVGPGATFCNDMWPSTSKVGFEIDGSTVIVEDGAVIGAGAIILPGVRIGAGSMIAAGVVCEESLPSGVLLRRNGYITAMPQNRKRMRYAP